MAPKKKPKKVVKLQLKAGMANPAPPVGTALGPTGIKSQTSVNNSTTQRKDRMGMVLPTIINIYEDRSFDFITKQPPMTYLIKTELNLKSGSKLPHKDKVANLTIEQLKKIAGLKMVDLNAHDEEHAMSIIAGSARSMGITTDLQRTNNLIPAHAGIWRHRLTVRTRDSHSRNRSSILRGVTKNNIKNILSYKGVFNNFIQQFIRKD